MLIKKGYLKHDLYSLYADKLYFEDEWAITLEAKQDILKKVESYFGILAPKGTEFFCYRYDDGEELWQSDKMDELDNAWAKNNLENVESCEKELQIYM